LSAFTEPVLHTVVIELHGSGLFLRIVGAHDLDKPAVAGSRLFRDHDAIKRMFFLADAGKANRQHSKFLLDLLRNSTAAKFHESECIEYSGPCRIHQSHSPRHSSYHFGGKLPESRNLSDISIRPAVRADLPRLTEVYNYYVVNTPVTFDIEPYTVERRQAWFSQFGATGRYRLFVAEEHGVVRAYAGTTRFRPKAAYETTVEMTVYCASEAVGKGLGARLYRVLFDALKGEDIRRFVAGYTLPNPASAALHERFGFKPVGVFTENGRKFDRYWDVAWIERPAKID
jgi:phosphinothricin acetyltransferase